MATEADQQFVEYILKSIVDHPDDVKVERRIDKQGVLISVHANPEDMGKVIGKSGQTAQAIRTLLKVVGAKNDARVSMMIIEPEGSDRGKGKSEDKADKAVSDETPTDVTAKAAAGTGAVPAEPATLADHDNAAQAVSDQQDTDAAVPQPSENDSPVDEATGGQQPQEPVSAAEEKPVEPAPSEAEGSGSEKKDDVLNEKSPLDEL